MDILIHLKQRLEHATKRALAGASDISPPRSDLTVYAGFDVFYWRGRQSALEDMIDYLEDKYPSLLDSIES